MPPRLSPAQIDKLLELLRLGVVPVRAADRAVPVLIRLGLAVACQGGAVRRTSRPRFVRLSRMGLAVARNLALQKRAASPGMEPGGRK